MSEVEAVSELVLSAQAKPAVFEAPEGRTFVAVPCAEGGFKLEHITSPNKADVLMPKIASQHVKMQTSESLADYVNRFKNDNSVLFADIDSDTVVGIVDYHEAATSGGVKAHLLQHRATLRLPKSLEWQTWSAVSDKLMTHQQFATFLEENSVDVVSPVGADLLELCRDLQVIQNVNFGSTVRMGDLTQVSYQKDSDATAKGTIALPASIILSIPVYFGEPKVSVMAFMRRSIEDGKLRLGVKLSRAESVRQAEFHRIVDTITESVGVTTVYGTPA